MILLVAMSELSNEKEQLVSIDSLESSTRKQLPKICREENELLRLT